MSDINASIVGSAPKYNLLSKKEKICKIYDRNLITNI